MNHYLPCSCFPKLVTLSDLFLASAASGISGSGSLNFFVEGINSGGNVAGTGCPDLARSIRCIAIINSSKSRLPSLLMSDKSLGED